MKDSKFYKISFIYFFCFCIFLTACVNQKPVKSEQKVSDNKILNNEKFLKPVNKAKERVVNLNRSPRIIATSPAIADICDKLNIDLVGVSNSNVQKLPERYAQVTKVGLAMNPDVEILAGLKADWILSPLSLMGDLRPKYDAIGGDWAFLNLNSVQGMYKSIEELGYIFGREDEAKKLIDDFYDFCEVYNKKHQKDNPPKVLILMGLPGSYLIATQHSYIGSLIKLAGWENVYEDEEKQFLNINTEDMKKKNPDFILRAAHALPEKVKAMFDKDFKENDIWKHFSAVKNNRVYDLSYDKFGMSAKFNYREALEELDTIFSKNEK